MATVPFPSASAVDALGIGRRLIEELALKILYIAGDLSVHELGERLCVSRAAANEVFERLRSQQLCVVTGMAGTIHRIAVSSAGRTRALELLSESHYTGPAPVALHDYVRVVQEQSIRASQIPPEDVRSQFNHLVIDDTTLDQLGTAVVSGKSLFLYGPTGAGKTTVAETLAGVFAREAVWLPHSVEVDGQIISVFDPATHERVATDNDDKRDHRWVLCRRPKVVVGGELTIEMLDLQFNPFSRFYSAPVQMKANNGVLIIDDFGRQRLGPEQLLNRWVIPLDRHTDFLSLVGGRKIEIPFDVFVIFATNLDPAKLVDDAFLRRIQSKVKLSDVSAKQFQEIFRRVCAENSLACDDATISRLIDSIRGEWNQPLRACHPRDIVRQVGWEARYRQREPRLDDESLARACRNYFLAS